jgi:hypothetical protein
MDTETKPTFLIHDVATGAVTHREMTNEEHLQYLQDQANAPVLLEVTDETPSPA